MKTLIASLLTLLLFSCGSIAQSPIYGFTTSPGISYKILNPGTKKASLQIWVNKTAVQLDRTNNTNDLEKPISTQTKAYVDNIQKNLNTGLSTQTTTSLQLMQQLKELRDTINAIKSREKSSVVVLEQRPSTVITIDTTNLNIINTRINLIANLLASKEDRLPLTAFDSTFDGMVGDTAKPLGVRGFKNVTRVQRLAMPYINGRAVFQVDALRGLYYCDNSAWYFITAVKQ